MRILSVIASVRNSGVSAMRELTVLLQLTNITKINSDLKYKIFFKASNPRAFLVLKRWFIFDNKSVTLRGIFVSL